MTGDVDVDALLERAGFDPEASGLTRRQAEILALREHGASQEAIAERLDTSRANVAGIEASARANVRKAYETVGVVEALRAPVSVPVEVGTDLFDVPPDVYDACDDLGLKVDASAMSLLSAINRQAGGAVQGREVVEPLTVVVTSEGDVRVRHPGE